MVTILLMLQNMYWVQVDTMIVQAIGLLDDLDKELNTYAMRVREWYGWHFPEMTRIVADNVTYAKAVSATTSSQIPCYIMMHHLFPLLVCLSWQGVAAPPPDTFAFKQPLVN
jgi:RNA processing factor Prp31